jgi:uncharacterized membrane protein HdeD (DUF308 family)
LGTSNQNWPRDFAGIAAYVVGALLIIHSIWQGISRRPAPTEQVSLFWGLFFLALLILCGFIIHISFTTQQ